MMWYGYGGPMAWGGGAYIFMFVTWLIVIIDLILAGIWLWQQITKK